MRALKVIDHKFSKQKCFGKICSQVKPEFHLSALNNYRTRKKKELPKQTRLKRCLTLEWILLTAQNKSCFPMRSS